jgi:UDPglucose--hexose-1-phosphate uridylyltransferase
MIGSNADLPIVGGSILSHEHYQGGNYLFPLAKAPEGFHFKLAKFPKVEFGIVDWPMSVIRAKSTDRKELSNACDFILGRWRKYSDSKRFIIASDEQGNHNTITPIARYREEKYEIDLALRCNCVSAQYPDGIFHPHQEKHHIKKENIGLIEVMGLAILPGRLKTELALCEKQLLAMAQEPDPSIVKHMEWLKAVKAKHPQLTAANVEKILEAEVGLVFEGVLEDCGVFKRDEEGQGGFKAFLASLDK